MSQRSAWRIAALFTCRRWRPYPQGPSRPLGGQMLFCAGGTSRPARVGRLGGCGWCGMHAVAPG